MNKSKLSLIFFSFYLCVFSSLHALTPKSFERIYETTGVQHDFLEMHKVFRDVLSVETKPSYKDMKELVADLQRIDPDFATVLIKNEDFWKLSFILDNGWDVTLPNTQGRDLLVEAIGAYHFPNIELVLKSGGTKILLNKVNREILKEAGEENNSYLENELAKWESWALNPKKYPHFLEGQPLSYRVEGYASTANNEMLMPSAAPTAPEAAPAAPPPLAQPIPEPMSPPPPPPLGKGDNARGNLGQARESNVNPNMFVVEVPYGTNRGMDMSRSNTLKTTEGAEAFYSFTDSGKISYGIARVTIPRTHKAGKLEERGLFERKWDPNKHVVLDQLTLLGTEEDFFKKVGELIKEREENFPEDKNAKEIFVYIHGFNVDFSYAMRKTAQLMFDMDYPGLSMAYSWPARPVKLPLPQDFRDDVLRAEASIANLEVFLDGIRREYPDRKINIIAHSLGTRVLSKVLLNLAKNLDTVNLTQGAQKLFGQVILAAPAIDATDFIEDWAPKITPLCDRISIMASDDDYALKVQSFAEDLKSFPLGLWTDTQAALALDIFNFDISNLSAGTFSLDHSVYSQVPSAINHMGSLLKNKPTEDQLTKLPYAKYLETQDRLDFFSLLKRRVWNFLQ
ncbi:MAG: alpha/beta hydrolase [Bdellovibrionota bacterium]